MVRTPSTPATRLLREQGIGYTEHTYRYEERGGTRVSARALGVDEHAVVKTCLQQLDLLVEREQGSVLAAVQAVEERPRGCPKRVRRRPTTA